MNTDATNNGLDAEELLHLAMKAMAGGDQEGTIAYLKRALAIAPDDGRLHYLLGAIHAELGMRDRAIVELTRATELVPHLETAHFQLGLLHAAGGDVARAVAAWEPIEALGPDNPLFLFRAGVLHLADGDYGACIEAIRAGIDRNQEYASLNQDMGRFLAQAEAAATAGVEPRETEERPAAEPSELAVPTQAAPHLLLSRYRTGPESGR